MDGPATPDLRFLSARPGGAPDGLQLKAEAGPAGFKADRKARTAEGIFSTWRSPENPDTYGEIVAPGAFEATIANEHAKGLVKGYWRHWVLLGTCFPGSDGLKETDEGLWARFPITKLEEGDRALTLLEEGAVLHGSIGFRVIESSEEVHDGRSVLVLKQIHLYEVSPVVWPADDGTSLAKGIGPAEGDLAAHILGQLGAITEALTKAGYMGDAADARKLADQVSKDRPKQPTGDLLDLDPSTYHQAKDLITARRALAGEVLQHLEGIQCP